MMMMMMMMLMMVLMISVVFFVGTSVLGTFMIFPAQSNNEPATHHDSSTIWP